MSILYREEKIEDNISETLEELGYKKMSNDNPYNSNNQQEIINYERLEQQLKLINKNLNFKYIEEAIKKIKTFSFSTPISANREIINFLKKGIPIKILNFEDRTYNVKLIDFNNINNNSFEYIRQLNLYNSKVDKIIPDIIIFINGLPLSIIELKAPEASENLIDAYNQLKNYSYRFSQITHWNVFSLVSNGFDTKYGSLGSVFSHWWSWKKIDIDSKIEQDVNYLENSELAKNNYRKNIIGLYNKQIFLNIINNYIFYSFVNGTPNIKYVPAYHQYWAVEKAVVSIHKAMIDKTGKGGVVWHTQGSGKSVTMVFLAKRIKDYLKNNYKLIYVTDRKELDNQLLKRFAELDEEYVSILPVKIESREDLLYKLGDNNNFGIFLTTIQKFTEKTSVLSERDNVIIIADEAHRSHNNLAEQLEIDDQSEEIKEKHGYASYIRWAFPNAIYLGFTGTPLMGATKTTDIFGDYIDKYTMNQAVLDGSTVPIHYEKRKIPIYIPEEDLKEIDEFYSILKEEDDSDFVKNEKIDYIKKNFIKIKKIFSQPELISKMVEDFWSHYNERAKALNGKAMFVAFDREIAFKVYNEMIKQKPDFKEKIVLMMTTSNKDTSEMLAAVPNNDQKDDITKEFRKDTSKYKIAVVVDMWLTGFDVPDLDTLYLSKIIRFHNLMQTIARVNRTYQFNNKDENKEIKKEDGLVVDYIGIWKYISQALEKYSGSSKDNTFDLENIINKLIKLSSETFKMFFGMYEYLKMDWLSSNEKKRYEALIEGRNIIDQLLGKDKDEFFFRTKRLSRYYKLCVQSIKDEDKEYKLLSQYLLLIKSLLRKKTIEEAEDVQETLKSLESKLSEIIKVGDIEVTTINLSGRKDLAFISKLIEKELKYIEENKKVNPINLEEIKEQVKHQINELRKVDTINSFKLSEKIKQLLEKYDNDKKIEEFIKEIQDILRKIRKCQDVANEVEDIELKQFYTIILDKCFWENNRDSKIAKEIMFKIRNIIKGNITPQWEYSTQLQSKINLEIKKMLRIDYNYPPETSNTVSKSLIDELNLSIGRNKKYWIEDGD